MEDHERLLKRKRYVLASGDDHEEYSIAPISEAPLETTETSSSTCYGTIVDTNIQLRRWPQSENQTTGLSFYRYSVVAQGQVYGLSAQDEVFAVFNKKACHYMHQLSNVDGVRLEGFIALRQIFAARKKASITMPVMAVDINIYGKREDAFPVGKILSSFGICLQQPVYGLENTTYYNPHFLHVDEFLGLGPAHETPRFQIRARADTNSHEVEFSDPSTPEPEQDDIPTEVDNVLSSLSHHAILGKKAGAVALKSQLKEYQMEGLDFICRRETGELPLELVVNDSGDQVYQHTIIGARRPQPSDIKGGILADEMGVGKTMVALATIAASLDRASDFVSSTPTNEAKITGRRRSKATLIIAPSSLVIDGWVDQIREHVYPGGLTFYKYHGPQRQQEANLLFEKDLIFSTYATLASEPDRGICILDSVEWFRIILDEAHDIRNTTTKQFQAVSRLAAEHRWCLTGTPIQNSVEDLGALVSFLRVPLFDRAATFRRYILNQAKHGSRNSFKNLQLLLSSICLRRTKDVAGMSDPVVQTRVLSFDPAERRDYVGLLDQLRTHFDMDISGHSRGGWRTRVLQGILKLRLFCNNGLMGRDASTMPFDADEVLSCLQQASQASCVLCSRPIYSISSVADTDGGCPLEPCSHLACKECAMEPSRNKSCPRCVEGDTSSSIRGILNSLKELEARNSLATDAPSQRSWYPSKLRAFVEDIQAQVVAKSIVFSFWKTSLDLVGQLLAARGLGFYMIHGSLPLSTGAVGLNLAVASRIYLLEPQWNPQLEQQAFGRAQRLGQTEQVTIIRYVMKDTVEDSNVLSRQTQKLRDAARGFEKSGRKPRSHYDQDLRDIFTHASPAMMRTGMPSSSELCGVRHPA
ncbi:hypothetical protein N8I77_008564 [Diaporthe amygdali]|uniref:Uncharacterized protein n=1 Tax=Phomopsis amygdali TaxID=1214568 RepID=A0AAD9SF79_PHOAM|nr:hypothetical protein N8I77_008564 [Diaporthe amygdali]